MPPIRLPLLTALALLATAGLAFLWARPAAAHADLVSARGAVAWFYRACSAPPGSPARWSVKPVLSTTGKQSLSISIENAYPGYRLECALHFANSGDLKLAVKEIKVLNPNPADLAVSAVEAAPAGRMLKSCGSTPRWGTSPARVSDACRSAVNLTMTLGPDILENTRLDFAVQVILVEKHP